MTSEANFIDLMRGIANDPVARGLNDDVAVLTLGQDMLILTHDMMVEGVHWLPGADPADVAWKLVATNLSDLAAKGAQPLGVLLGFTLGDAQWDARFAEGLKRALQHYGVSLYGGDSVAGGGARRALGLTAIGRATCTPVPTRSGAVAGDMLYVTGTIGDARAGYMLITADKPVPAKLRAAFDRPTPLIADGQKLARIVHAVMDVSDGLCLDAARMAKASGLAVEIAVDRIPLSPEYITACGDDVTARVNAASWGDDYQLLFALPEGRDPPVSAHRIGRFLQGQGITLVYKGEAISLPQILGFEHH